jgi:hypothetical protein
VYLYSLLAYTSYLSYYSKTEAEDRTENLNVDRLYHIVKEQGDHFMYSPYFTWMLY